jgi:putative dimethyl sulfoxide reductase chaperone
MSATQQMGLFQRPASAHEWRGHLYALLGAAYYRQPTREFVRSLSASGPFFLAPPPAETQGLTLGLRLLSESLAPFKRAISDPGLADLQADHFRLFTGSGMPKAPPWESYYRTEERLMFSHHTLDVRAWYERFGLVSERKGREPEDHIGLELEFMACLCDRSAESLRKGNVQETGAILQGQRDFLDDHLFPWVFRFCRNVDRSAGTEFFRAVARLTEEFLAWDRRLLGRLRADGLEEEDARPYT